MTTPPSVPGVTQRRPVVAVLAGACLGYVAAALVKSATLGALGETIRRITYKLQGGLGETANWGEPLFYVALLMVVPSAWTLGGALIGAGAAFALARGFASAGGLSAAVHNHTMAIAVVWSVMCLGLIGVSGWFVYGQWRRAREEVTRYRETTGERQVIVSPQFIVELRQECDVGKAGACTFLGQTYQFGQGVPIDYRRALESYRKGCEAGGSGACGSLGGMYEAGQAVRADAQAALGFYQRGCEGGYAVACRNIGALLQRGAPGVPMDLVKTVAALGKACELGDGWSCLTAGLMHERAQGTRQDYARAGELYRKSCDVRYAIGCQYLGDSYAHGEGVVRDDARAKALYLEAAGLLEKDCAGGDASSCYGLGTMYRQGQGVPADPRKARDLLDRGCRGGNQDACAGLKTLN